VLFIVLFWRLGVPSFWDPDEAHYAETTRELIATGDWWTPYYDQALFFDKPIFFHQLQAVSMLAVGETELGSRLVPAIAALGLLFFTGWLGATLVSADAGVVAALILAVNPGVFGLARYAILDTLFTLCLFGGVGLLAVAALRERLTLQYAGYTAIAAAVMTKGPVALVLCGVAMAISMAMSSAVRKQLLRLHWAAGLGIALAIACPWFIYMYVRFRDAFVAAYVLNENIRLFATSRFDRQPGVWFYLQIVATGFLPWTALLVGRLVDDVRAVIARRSLDGVEVLLWAWAMAVTGFFTLSHFKLDHYVFPAAPALCLLCARAWVDLHGHPHAPEHRGARIGLLMVGPLLVLLGIATGYFLVARLDLPAAALAVPVAVIGGGVLMTARLAVLGGRPPRVPWIALAALTTIYAGVVLFVMPALERQKVVPDVARWVAAHTDQRHRIASYQLNRWNPAFRFYVDRPVAMLESEEDVDALARGADPFYCVMLEPAYDDFVAHGVPLAQVYAREGMWATSGRALWRAAPAPTRFVVVTGPPR
jgi:4-amino-4-deoxy-L-arabinose transferase-like glycosyltransferase